jgi:hypothetical protein
LHEVIAGIREVVYVEELPFGGAGAPDGHGLVPALLRFVKFADEGRQYVGLLQIVVIIGPVQVGGHNGDEVAAVLVAVGVAQLDASDLGDGVGLVEFWDLGNRLFPGFSYPF